MSDFPSVSHESGQEWEVSSKHVRFSVEGESLIDSPQRARPESPKSRYNTLSSTSKVEALFDDEEISVESSGSSDKAQSALVSSAHSNQKTGGKKQNSNHNGSKTGNSSNTNSTIHASPQKSPSKKERKRKAAVARDNSDIGSWDELAKIPVTSTNTNTVTSPPATKQLSLSMPSTEVIGATLRTWFQSRTNLAFIALFLIIIISFYDHHLQRLYRGHAGINDLLHARGYTGQKMSHEDSIEHARDMVRSHRLLHDATNSSDSSWKKVLGVDSSTNHNKSHLNLEILSPIENSIIGESSDNLSLLIDGNVLNPMYYKKILGSTSISGKDTSQSSVIPSHVNVTIDIYMNGNILIFPNHNNLDKNNKNTFEIALENAMRANIALHTHGIQNGVNLIEGVVTVHDSAYTHAPDSRSITSVAFYYFDEKNTNIKTPKLQISSTELPIDTSVIPLQVTLKSVEKQIARNHSINEDTIAVSHTLGETSNDASSDQGGVESQNENNDLRILSPSTGTVMKGTNDLTLVASINVQEALSPRSQLVLIYNEKRYDITQHMIEQIQGDEMEHAQFSVNLSEIDVIIKNHSLQLSLVNIDDDIRVITEPVIVYVT